MASKLQAFIFKSWPRLEADGKSRLLRSYVLLLLPLLCEFHHLSEAPHKTKLEERRNISELHLPFLEAAEEAVYEDDYEAYAATISPFIGKPNALQCNVEVGI